MAHLQERQVPIAGDSTFSKAARLRKHSDFEQVYVKGRRLFTTHMTFFFAWREPASTMVQGARIGFTIPKALGCAVVRNRLRRRLREAVRLEWSQATGSLDVVIHPRKSALTSGFSELRLEVAHAFEKMKSHVANSRMAEGKAR